VDRLGRGTHGSVYLAEGVVPEATGRVAVKLSHHPLNARFVREAELLSRLHHPSVPRLIGQGQWTARGRMPHAWLAMEFVDGLPLYEWARAFQPSSRQVLRVLAELARALEATHALGGVHRDVKGDNALVRTADGRAFLIDFGSCTYPGAAPLTQPVFPPQTQEYRSPEAFHFGRNILKSQVKVYSPKPDEDVFALGVTGYRLVTGEYPPLPDPTDAHYSVWRTEGLGPLPAQALNPCCTPELSALISRMLSREPEARGSAGELARALEKAARKRGQRADVSLFVGGTQHRVEGVPVPPRAAPQRPRRSWRVAASVAGAMTAVGAVWMLRTPGIEEPVSESVAEQEEDTVAVGNSVRTAPVASPHTASAGTSIAMDMPDRPFPGQLRTDARGHCPNKSLVPINGGCWMEMRGELEHCREISYVYNGKCYQPFFSSQRPATSGPSDGGTESHEP
jgi:serine/threonine-protein kinase